MVGAVDDRFVDVTFEDEADYVRGSLEPNFFGFTSFESAVEQLTDSQIEEAMERIAAEDSGAEHLVTRIFDQKQEGSCVSQGCGQANQITQAKQFGRDGVIQLSGMSLYKQIGRSAQSGATVSDGIETMAKLGMLPLDTPENRAEFGNAVMENTGFNSPYPADWKLTAKRFRAHEYHVVQSARGIWTALCHRNPVIVGREGHCICYTTPIIHKRKWAAQYANSWSEGWGFGDAGFSGGFGVDTLNQVKKSANWAVVVRSVVDRGGVI